jgi:phosphatidate cytidylyltransferase
MSSHLKRILIAAVGIPYFVIVSYIGGLLFFVTISCISALALYEFYKLARLKGSEPQIALGLIAGFFINISFFHDKLQSAALNLLGNFNIFIPFPSQTQLLYIVLTIIVITVCLVELFRNRGSAFLNISVTIFGLLYIPFFLGTFIGIRELFVPFDFPVSRFFTEPASFTNPYIRDEIYRWGGYTIISILAIIWICDSAAYYIGSAVGKHKLFPRVSPNKSWEGAVAGFVCAVISAILLKIFFLNYLSMESAVVFGIIIGTIGQMGDLVESLFKRDAGVKDSSNIIPGHGGVLDRFDSLILTSPVIYLYIDFIFFS